jgi:hypothetical protein
MVLVICFNWKMSLIYQVSKPYGHFNKNVFLALGGFIILNSKYNFKLANFNKDKI